MGVVTGAAAPTPPFNGGTITSPLKIDSDSLPQLKIEDPTGATVYAGISAYLQRLDFYADPNGASAPAIQMRSNGLFLRDELFAVLVNLAAGVLSLGPNDQLVLRGTAAAFTANSAPASSDLVPGEVTPWFDKTDGAAKLMLKGKSANGTVVTAAIALS